MSLRIDDVVLCIVFFQAEDGIGDLVRFRGLGDVYKRQEGHIAYPGAGDRTGLSYDRGRNDDVDQFTFGVARRLTPEETTLTLERGDVVLNGGIYFVYRTQNPASYTHLTLPPSGRG